MFNFILIGEDISWLVLYMLEFYFYIGIYIDVNVRSFVLAFFGFYYFCNSNRCF